MRPHGIGYEVYEWSSTSSRVILKERVLAYYIAY
jgi:hypothetical protein